MPSDRFVPSPAPPEHATGDALVVLVRDRTVAVLDGDVDDALLAHARVAGHFLGVLDGRPCWAVATDEVGDITIAAGEPAYGDLRGLWGGVDEIVWTVAGRAVQLVDWDRTHRFCGRCATPTEPAPGERARRCPQCGLLAFPRLAPAVITLVERDDGRALLAHGRNFPLPMYSCLAGFVEPGETLEAAVRREIYEEVGVEVDDVRYWGSQPWPFPHSLMIGFTARFAGGELRLDPAEIVDAGWFAADDLPMIPPDVSIARRLIDDWLARARREPTGSVTR